MSLATIPAQFINKPVKLDDTKQRRVLRTLIMTYEGGSLDGKAANFPRRDVSCVVAGLHRGSWHLFETYKRTIWVNVHNRRTIFRRANVTVRTNKSSWWKSLLAFLRIRKLKAIIIS